MSPDRRQQLGMLASSVAGNLAFHLPDAEEATFVARRVHAMMFANGVDLPDMSARGLSIEAITEASLEQYRSDVRAIIQQRILQEHEDQGGKAH